MMKLREINKQMEDYIKLTIHVSKAYGDEELADKLGIELEKELFRCLDDKLWANYFDQFEKENLFLRYNHGCEDGVFFDEVFEKFNISDVKKLIFLKQIEICLELEADDELENLFLKRKGDFYN